MDEEEKDHDENVENKDKENDEVKEEDLSALKEHFEQRKDFSQDNDDQDNGNDNEEEHNTNNNEGDESMSEKAYVNTKTEGPKSPQADNGVNQGRYKEYGETVLSTIDLTYDDISQFIMDSVKELNPIKVDWVRSNYSKISRSIKNDSRVAIDTIVKITGANYRDGNFSGGFDAIPILVFDQKDVLTSVNYSENLGAVSRDMWELDFEKLKKKNQKFFPKYGMVTSYDQANNLVRVHLNIINVIISALGYEPSDFGNPKEMNKLYLFPKQDSTNETFKVTVINNKYINDRILNAVKNM